MLQWAARAWPCSWSAVVVVVVVVVAAAAAATVAAAVVVVFFPRSPHDNWYEYLLCLYPDQKKGRHAVRLGVVVV